MAADVVVADVVLDVVDVADVVTAVVDAADTGKRCDLRLYLLVGCAPSLDVLM